MKTIKDVERYAKKVIPLLNLSHWEIDMYGSNKEIKDTYATSYPSHKYKRASIEIHNYFYRCSEKNKKLGIIHELLHCHTCFYDPSYELFMGSTDVSQKTHAMFKNSIIDAEEECVELLARAIYKLIENAS